MRESEEEVTSTMREVVASWTSEDLVWLCREAGELVTRGPLNNTYRVSTAQAAVFVRHRTLRDPDYGQTFAAEKYLPQQVTRHVRVPELYRVITDEAGQGTYALFEYIESVLPDWRKPDLLNTLVDCLVQVHAIEGIAFGDICGPFNGQSATTYLFGLLETELNRLGDEDGPSTAAQLRRAAPLLAELFEVFEQEGPRLCHGDVHSANVMVDAHGRMWLVDWEAVRFRVAAADFNQLHMDWLDAAQQRAVLIRYCEVTGREVAEFSVQVDLLRLLWHVRTYNFYTGVRAEPDAHHLHHLDRAVALLDGFRRGGPARTGTPGQPGRGEVE